MAKKKIENVKTPVNTGIVDDFLNENIGTTVKEVKPKTQKKEKKQKPKIEVPQDVNIENLIITDNLETYANTENLIITDDLTNSLELNDNNDEDIVLGEISLEGIIDEQNSTETDSDILTEEKVENPPIEENKSVSSPKIRIVNTFSGIHYDI
mgnify:CR=1 FL=1